MQPPSASTGPFPLAERRLAARLWLAVAIAGWGGSASAQLARVSDSVVDPAALIMNSSAAYGRAINGESFQVNALQTIGGYQYTAWYTNDANASVMLARRPVSGTSVGSWDAVNTGSKFTNGKASADAHNVISFGIAADGSIHMAWDMHGHNLRYRRTAAGVATSGSGWGTAMFQPEQSFLMPGESTVTAVTYPNFVSKPNGGLLLAIRRGSSGNGDNWLYDYDGGQWHDGRMITSRTGTFTDAFNPASSPSTSRNPYWNGYDYGPDGTLHTSWTWRESSNQYANHDICYASSPDGGITWQNNAGVTIGNTARAQPMSLASPGLVVQPLDRTQSLINQQAQIVMGDGSVHAVMYHRRDDQPWTSTDAAYVPADCSYFDYVRDPATGSWTRNEIPGLVGTRAALARSADDTLYAVFVSPGTPLTGINVSNGASGQVLTIAAAHKASGWSDWSIVHRDYLRSFANEPRVDAGRLLTSGVLSVYAQENTWITGTTGTPLRVIDFVPAASPPTDGWAKAGGGSWSSAANWSPAGVPTSGTATIGYGFMGGAITLDAATTLNRLTFLGASGTLAPGTGGTLTFGGSAATAFVESALTVSAPVSGAFTKGGGGLMILAADNAAGLAGRTLTVRGGQLMPGTSGSASGAEFGTATTTLVVEPTGQLWMAGLTTGSRTFAQTLRLSGSGAGAGGYGAVVNDSATANGVVLAGPVIVDADATIAALGNATYVFGSGSTGFAESAPGRTLSIALAAGTSTLTGTVGVSTLAKQGAGTLRLGAANRVIDSGTIRVEGGTLDLGATSERIATLVLAGGGVTSGTLQAAVYDLQSGTLAAVVTGSGGITKTGPGSATLAGTAVSFSGTITVTGGVLAITSTTALPGWNVAGRFAVSGGATLAVPASFSDATITTLVNTGNFASGGRLGLVTTATTRALSFGAGGQGGLGLVLNGSGTVTASGSNGYSGGTVLAGGLARVTAASGLGSGTVTITGSAARVALGSSVALGNDFVVDAPSGVVANGVIQYEGSGTGRLAGGSVTVLGSPGSGGVFASTGGGTLMVEGPVNAPTGAVVSMRIGTVVFSGGGTCSTFFINEGTARAGRNDGLPSGATITVGASATATLDLAGYDQTLAGIVKGPGAATVGSSSTTRDATLTLTGSSTFAGTLANSVGTGSRRLNLAVDGGWLRLTGSNTLTGTTTVRNGTLQVATSRGLAASPLRILAGGTLTGTGTSALSVAGLAVNSGGLVDLGSGSLAVAPLGIATADLTAALRIGRGAGDWNSGAGITSAAVAAAVAAGMPRALGWVAAGDGAITIAAAAPGDTNLDGLLDVLDVANATASGLFDAGSGGLWANGDVNYDSQLDILDLSEMLGTGLFDAGPYLPAAAGSIAAVPEPSSAAVVACGTLLLLTITAVRSSPWRVPALKSRTAR